MPRYPIITVDNQRYYPMRYNDLRVGVRGEPATALIPFYDSLPEALAAVHTYVESLLAPLRKQFSGSSADSNATYRDKLANPTVFFRGQDNLKFSIVPTRFRLAGVADPKTEVERRVQKEQTRAAAIQDYFREHGRAELSELQARAAARHFGVPSTLVDFTFDPDVAAFFAHPPFSEQEQRDGATLGVIYAIDMGQLQETFGMMAWGINDDGGRDIHLVNTKTTWGIEFLGWDAQAGTPARQALAVPVSEALRREHARLRTCIVPGVSRIEAQRGLFLELSLDDKTDARTQLFFWTILDFLATKWCFCRADHVHVASDAGGNPRDLFHEKDSELERVAGGRAEQ